MEGQFWDYKTKQFHTYEEFLNIGGVRDKLRDMYLEDVYYLVEIEETYNGLSRVKLKHKDTGVVVTLVV